MFAKRRKRRRHLRQIIDDRQTGPEAEHQRHEHEPKVGEEDERGGSHALARRVEARRASGGVRRQHLRRAKPKLAGRRQQRPRLRRAERERHGEARESHER